MSFSPTPVHFSTIHGGWPWLRQSPNNDGIWENVRFQLDDEKNEAEWLVVFDEPGASLRTTVPYERRILFITEPPGIKSYTAEYVNQFRFMVSPYAVPGFRGRHQRQQSALNWQYGIDQSRPPPYPSTLDWSVLAADKPKSKLASVVCSSKTRLPQHRERLAFVELLKQRLGDRIDVFGRGICEVDDKQAAISAYKYHIVLENNLLDHFWTEKLADAYLGDAFPIFSGSANLNLYFHPDSYRDIDICNPDQAAIVVESIVNSKLWDDRREIIKDSRRRLMYEYNYFAVVASIVQSNFLIPLIRIAPTAIRPLSRGRIKKLRRRLYKLFASGSSKKTR